MPIGFMQRACLFRLAHILSQALGILHQTPPKPVSATLRANARAVCDLPQLAGRWQYATPTAIKFSAGCQLDARNLVRSRARGIGKSCRLESCGKRLAPRPGFLKPAWPRD